MFFFVVLMGFGQSFSAQNKQCHGGIPESNYGLNMFKKYNQELYKVAFIITIQQWLSTKLYKSYKY